MRLYGAPRYRTNQTSFDNSNSPAITIRNTYPFESNNDLEINQQQKIIKSIIASPTNLIRRVQFDDPDIEIPKLFVKKTQDSKQIRKIARQEEFGKSRTIMQSYNTKLPPGAKPEKKFSPSGDVVIHMPYNRQFYFNTRRQTEE